MPNPKVFVSYSWGMEEQTNLVAELEKQCLARGIELIQDKNVLKHGDRIKTFMDDLAKAEHIITVFSKLYFKSEWCMYELLKIYERGDFYQRTHHLIADDCKLNDGNYRLELVEFWRKLYDDRMIELKKHNPIDIQSQIKLAERFRDYYQKIDALLDFAADRLTTELQILKEKQFAPLLDRIQPAYKEKTSSDTNEYWDAKPDNELIIKIKEKIIEELNIVDMTEFRSVLKLEIDKVLDNLNQPKLSDNKAELIADGLVLALQIGGIKVPVINSALTNAAMQCFDRRGKHYQNTQSKHKAIEDAIKQLLGWLVLASVVEDKQQNLQPKDFPDVFFLLPVKTAGCVELIVSRHYGRNAKLDTNGNDISVSNQLYVSSSLFSWKTIESVETLKRMLWNQVHKQNRESNLSLKETEELDADLLALRETDWYGEHHVLAIECSDLVVDEPKKQIYQQLLTELPNLTLVHFGVSKNESLFYVPEYNLMSAIKLLLNNINKALNS